MTGNHNVHEAADQPNSCIMPPEVHCTMQNKRSKLQQISALALNEQHHFEGRRES